MMGAAIGAGDLNVDAPDAVRLVDWLRRLFKLSQLPVPVSRVACACPLPMLGIQQPRWHQVTAEASRSSTAGVRHATLGPLATLKPTLERTVAFT